jgi:hypothetical protein
MTFCISFSLITTKDVHERQKHVIECSKDGNCYHVIIQVFVKTIIDYCLELMIIYRYVYKI